MEFIKPKGVLAGFHVRHPDPKLPGLHHIGEEWLSSTFLIGQHKHAFWEFYLQLDGWSHWETKEGSHSLSAGTVLAVPPNTSHQLVKASTSHHFIFIGLNPDERSFKGADYVNPPQKTSEFSANLSFIAACRQLSREVTLQQSFPSLGLHLAMSRLILEWQRHLMQDVARPHEELKIPAGLEHCRELVARNPAENWTLTALSQIAGISPKHFSEMFKKHFGKGFRDYHLGLRINEAKRLLETTDAPITEVALGLGFASSQTFARAFRAVAGITPSDYRKSR